MEDVLVENIENSSGDVIDYTELIELVSYLNDDFDTLNKHVTNICSYTSIITVLFCVSFCISIIFKGG